MPPIKPAGPKVLLNTALATVLGVMLGLGFSILAEMLNRRVRSENDVAEVLDIPMLGAVDWTASAAPKRTSFMNTLTLRRLRAN